MRWGPYLLLRYFRLVIGRWSVSIKMRLYRGRPRRVYYQWQ